VAEAFHRSQDWSADLVHLKGLGFGSAESMKALTRRHPPAAGLILEIDIGEEQPLASKRGGVAEATETGTAIANGAGL
jgi:hypothetical protein